jgi:hypothetical protein
MRICLADHRSSVEVAILTRTYVLFLATDRQGKIDARLMPFEPSFDL